MRVASGVKKAGLSPSPMGDFATFNRFLASALARGEPAGPVLRLLAPRMRAGRLRAAVLAAAEAVEEGASLGDALRRREADFPPGYPALVEASLSGKDPAAGLRLAGLEADLRLAFRRRMFPIVFYLVLAGILFAILTMAGASLGTNLAELDGEPIFSLGDRTRLAEWIQERRLPLAACLSAAGIGGFLGVLLGIRFLSRTRFAYWIPLWGRVLRARDQALFCSVMAGAIRRGRNSGEGLQAAAAALAPGPLRRAAERMIPRQEEGETLADSLSQENGFPRTLAFALDLSLRGGEPAEVFEAFAEIKQAEMERGFALLPAVLIPVGFLALGGLVSLAHALLLSGFVSLTLGFPPLLLLQGTVALTTAAGLAAVLILFHRAALEGRERARALVEHLHALARSGLPVAGAFSALARDIGGRLGRDLRRTAFVLGDGLPLSEALAAGSVRFDPAIREMIRLGERAGNLPAFLGAARLALRRREERAHRALSALIYPLLVVASVCLIAGPLMIFIVPKVAAIHDAIGGAKNLPRAFGWVRDGSIVPPGACLLVLLALDSAPRLAAIFPFLPPFRDDSLERFASALAILLRAGASLPEAAGAAGDGEPRRILRRRFEAVAGRLRDGAGLSDACRGVLPPEFSAFAEAGETAGDLPGHLFLAADHFGARAGRTRAAILRATAILLLLLAGISVLLVFIACFFPIFKLQASLIR